MFISVSLSLFSGVDLGVYAALGVGQAVLVLLGSFALALGAIFASRSIHDNMLSAILRAPMSFFDTTPLGRILNRFSKVEHIPMVYLLNICTCTLLCTMYSRNSLSGYLHN